MSRSQPALTNPSEHFFQWSGSKGQLEWYDKAKGVRVPVKIPFEFLVLDELATITGFCEPDGSSYWSNEVRNVSKDEFIVRTSKGIKGSGLYANLADVRSKGAKYAKSIYIAHKIGDDWVMGNIKASGAALTAWIELGQRHVIQSGKVKLVGNEAATKGATKYFIPVFEWDNTDEDEEAAAIALDKQLQVYLSQYLSQPAITEHEDTVMNGDTLPEVIEDGRHNSRSFAMSRQEDKDEDEEIKALMQSQPDEVIPEDDIPF